jgi:hypothetical protein
MKARPMTAVLITLFVSVTLHAADGPHIGTWKLNLAKSKYSPGPPPKSQTITYEANGTNGIKVTVRAVNSDGNNTTTEYSGNFDGKQVPYVQTPPPATGSPQMVTLKRIGSDTIERTTYLAGKKLTTIRSVVSKDGKTLTNTQSGTNAQGQAVSTVSVYDKQ